MYESKFTKHSGKLQIHQLGPYLINSITPRGAVQMQQLDGVILPKLVNGRKMKPYKTGYRCAMLEALGDEKKYMR